MDLDRDVLEATRLLKIRDTVLEFTEDLSDQTDHEPIDGQPTDDVEAAAAVEEVAAEPALSHLPVLQIADLKPEWMSSDPILCIAGRTPLDEAAAVMMSHLCRVHGLSVQVKGADVLFTANIFGLDVSGVAVVCLLYLNTANSAHMRYAVRRLRRKAIFLALLRGVDPPDAALDSTKADAIVFSLREAVRTCINEATVNNVISNEDSGVSVKAKSA